MQPANTLILAQEHLGYIIVVLIHISLLANDTVDILKQKEMMHWNRLEFHLFGADHEIAGS